MADTHFVIFYSWHRTFFTDAEDNASKQSKALVLVAAALVEVGAFHAHAAPPRRHLAHPGVVEARRLRPDTSVDDADDDVAGRAAAEAAGLEPGLHLEEVPGARRMQL